MKDNFSTQSGGYAKHRPQYPASLFEFIISYVNDRQFAWDCGTGNGQAAKELSKYFDEVYASDISSKQIEHAEQRENIRYIVEPAENTTLENNSVDLVAISQALHWFDFDKFYEEVKRVSKPKAVIAAWTYNLLKIDPVTDALIDHYHFETLGKYWDEERKYVDDGYRSLPFPFREIESPDFEIKVNWRTEELEGFLDTWSAQQKFIKANNSDPLPALMNDIRKYWAAGETREIRFPVQLKLGYVHNHLQDF